MPDPTSHHPSMLRITDTLPPLWWLNPWGLCRSLHTSVRALKDLSDRQDDLLRGKYTTRPRWIVERWESENGVRYYFHDTDPDIDRGRPTALFRGKCYLYDAESKCFASETDPAKAIERLSDLNR